MLRDEEWRSSFFAENHKRMREHFAIATGFFKKHDISYYENMYVRPIVADNSEMRRS
jgi:hypothetical protein